MDAGGGRAYRRVSHECPVTPIQLQTSGRVCVSYCKDSGHTYRMTEQHTNASWVQIKAQEHNFAKEALKVAPPRPPRCS